MYYSGFVGQQGREYNFIAEPSDALKCLICHDPAQDAMQHDKCGKLFCQRCIERYGREKPCPHCRDEEPNYFEDNRSKLSKSRLVEKGGLKLKFNFFRQAGISIASCEVQPF